MSDCCPKCLQEIAELDAEVARLKQERDTAVAAEYATVGEFAQAKIDAERAARQRAEGQVAALREPMLLAATMLCNPEVERAIDKPVLAGTINRVLADTAQAAASHDQRVRREALEEAARLCEVSAEPFDHPEQDVMMMERVAAAKGLAVAIRALASVPAESTPKEPNKEDHRGSST